MPQPGRARRRQDLNLSYARRTSFSARLASWYARHKRDLPWRHDAGDPYRIWVSETLLQQTQVATVPPYYKRFLARFPTVRALASAPLDDVLKAWEGAGYYARARNLHRAAKEIIANYGGQIPSAVEELLTLPGIGEYTAGAIASIAFNRDEPVLDGNVTRVLCRYLALERDPRQVKTRDLLWKLARSLIPRGKAARFNQALMDLGATVCKPRSPSCAMCPVREGCAARRLGIQEHLPAKSKRKPLPHHQVAVGIIWKRGRILIAKRFAKDLLGGLWEFPGGHQETGESLEQCVAREVREELGIGISVSQEFAVLEHGYSHFRITLHAYVCEWRRGTARPIACADCKWVSPRQLSRYAFPSANRKIIARLVGEP